MFQTLRFLKEQLHLILTKKQKKQIVFLSFMLFLGALLEAFSVSVIVPFVTLITREDAITRIPLLEPVLNGIGITSSTGIVFSCIILLILVYILKALYLLLEQKMLCTFIGSSKSELHDRAAVLLLEKPYVYFLARNTADMHRALVTDTRKVSHVIADVLTMLTESMVCLMLTLVLFVIHPAMSASVLLMIIVAVSLINLYVRARLTIVGRLASTNERLHMKWVNQGFSGIKEVKHLQVEDFISNHLRKTEKAVCDAEAEQLYLRSIPRIVVETMCICGMLGILAAMALFGQSLSDLLPAISAFAMAAMKLLPSANRMTVAAAGINYNKPALENLSSLLQESSSAAVPAIMPVNSGHGRESNHDDETSGFAVSFRHVSFQYPGTNRNILNDVTLEILSGETVGIIGPSGAGKTTFVDLLLGLLEPNNGEVKIGTGSIGYIPQNLFMLDDSVRANVAFGLPADQIDDSRVWACLEESMIADHFRSVPEGLDLRMGERGTRLSGGQVQRVGIARALYRNPDILVLDEATSALDPETEAAVMETVNSLHGKRTIIIVAHGEGALVGCDTIYRMENGQFTVVR